MTDGTAIWALIDRRGGWVIRHVPAGLHPAEAGHAAECAGCVAVQLAREPDQDAFEIVNRRGRIGFDSTRARAAILAEVRAEAARRIEAVAPLWRQQNDLREPSEAGAARFAEIDRIRAASNRFEAEATGLRSAATVRRLRARIKKDDQW